MDECLDVKLLWNNFKNITIEYNKKREELNKRESEDLLKEFERSWLKEKLLKLSWDHWIDLLQKWSCWEANRNECIEEVISTYRNYLPVEDEYKIFNEDYISGLCVHILKKEL